MELFTIRLNWWNYWELFNFDSWWHGYSRNFGSYKIFLWAINLAWWPTYPELYAETNYGFCRQVGQKSPSWCCQGTINNDNLMTTLCRSSIRRFEYIWLLVSFILYSVTTHWYLLSSFQKYQKSLVFHTCSKIFLENLFFE